MSRKTRERGLYRVHVDRYWHEETICYWRWMVEYNFCDYYLVFPNQSSLSCCKVEYNFLAARLFPPKIEGKRVALFLDIKENGKFHVSHFRKHDWIADYGVESEMYHTLTHYLILAFRGLWYSGDKNVTILNLFLFVTYCFVTQWNLYV